ncbi:T9SS type A sorting domain-containing protein [Aureivirga marina]|uniref:T9SS type A sorting domain-containing protein n=1 Tax=Aureivirga marina TaxID=1182451 RepID=UPI0018CAA902|nr:T9SS type A sorting domain-containing protein [Aureivirga marina]
MKKQLHLFTLFILSTIGLNAQTILFQENFESAPITSMVHSYDNSEIPTDNLTCGKSSIGTTAFFNSTDLDFKNAENSTVFLGINTHDPCGGIYSTDLKAENLDLSGVSQLYFQCRYFISTPKDWGPSTIEFKFTKGSTTHEITSEFTVEDAWTNMSVALPTSLIQEDVKMEIKLGGEGIAIDDIYLADEVITVDPVDNPSILFEEDFETFPLTSSFVHSYDGAEIPQNNLECGKASVGDATYFNSTNLDFLESENDSDYLGINTEEPCGGFYNTNVKVENVDLSGVSELFFQCRYFLTSPLDWGDTSLKVTFSKGTTTHVIESEFSVEDKWTNMSVALPAALIQEDVKIEIRLEGEGVAIDDIFVADEVIATDGEVLAIAENNIKNMKIYPNPTTNIINFETTDSNLEVYIYDIQGIFIKQENLKNQRILDFSMLTNGVYILKVKDSNSNVFVEKIIKN